MQTLSLRRAMICVAATLAAGCGGAGVLDSPGSQLASQHSSYLPQFEMAQQSFAGPALITINTNNGKLEDWPIRTWGGHDPKPRSKALGVSGAYAMAADGNTLAIPAGNSVLLYNLANAETATLPDPYGFPIDVAFGKHGTLYALNVASGAGNLVMYRASSPQPQLLTCAYIATGEEIAVDNEGDVFVNGYEKNTPTGVVEIPNPLGAQPESCFRLKLNYENSPAGLAIDPKTDDLITLDNPGQCAGGEEGRMTIYSKPYERSKAVVRNLGGNCTGELRLDATSTIVFYGDEDVSGSYTYIQQRTYPDGKDLGTYWGGGSGGFTTIPNRLAN